jgi:hypothetical protein
MMKEMDEEMKALHMEMAKNAGIEESMVDEKVMWAMHKAMWGGMKFMKALQEKGMSEEKAMETMKKFANMEMSPEMKEKVKAMMEKMTKEWEEKKAEMKDKAC